MERLGLLTIIVCGESFVKVSLLAADGTLDGIDLMVLVTMFVFVFGVWWAYFDDVPAAGLRPQPWRAAGWLFGHLLVQLALVASAVGYGKVLGFELGSTLSGDTSLLLTTPLVGVLVGLALLGVCSRRVPHGPLVVLRLGVAALVAVGAVVTWQTGWISADGGAVVLALVAIGQAAVAAVLLRRTRVEPLDLSPHLHASPGWRTGAMGYKGTRHDSTNRGICHGHGDDRPLHDHLGRHATPAAATRRTASTSTRSTSTTSTPGATSTRTRSRTCGDEPPRPQLGRRACATPTRRPTASSARSIFPNTVPPFFPSFVLFAPPPKPEEYEHRLAGIRAHNRWLVDFCARYPERRAGIGQIFLNDVDDAIEDVQWIKEHGLRGGVLLPNIPPDVKWVKPLYDPDYDRLWEVLRGPRDPGQRARRHRLARLRPLPVVAAAHTSPRCRFYSQRPFVQLMLVGRVRALPAASSS